jgi:hypothetical protein
LVWAFFVWCGGWVSALLWQGVMATFIAATLVSAPFEFWLTMNFNIV